MNEALEMRLEGLCQPPEEVVRRYSHTTAKRRCAHGIFKYGQCAECKDEAKKLEQPAISCEERVLGACLDEAKNTICGERQDQYGAPEDSFHLVAQYWNTYLTKGSRVVAGPLTAKDIAHMMVLFKMARVQGQAPKRDNYVDICGYAAIAADRF